MKKHSDFAHLHVHTNFSLLEGACRIKPLVERAAELGLPALALTDHGNMFGAIEFYQACMSRGIKPIIGCELYLAEAPQTGSGASHKAHSRLVVLAKNEQGYANLTRLISYGYIEGLDEKPCITYEYLREHAQGLIGLTGGMRGRVHQLLAQDQYALAEAELRKLKDFFGAENLYVELQNHGLDTEKQLLPKLTALAKRMELSCVATNDIHYMEQSHAPAHDALLAIQQQTTVDDPGRYRLERPEYYVKTPEQMKALFKEYPEALQNTLRIAERCNLEIEFDKLRLPHFELPEGVEHFDYLKGLCEEGMRARYPVVAPELTARLEHELGVIKGLGYTSYFLIVWDFVRYAKEQGIPVGPGRGSAAGSMVSYCLGITNIEPMKFDLLFERFLNPERVTMPDIDIDFCYERRGEVIDYVIRKYGTSNVAQIITFGTMQAKAVIRDVARVLRMSYGEADRLAKMIPMELDIKLTKALNEVAELKDLYETDEQVRRLIDYALVLEGLTRHASMHAAGITVGDRPLTEYAPLFKSHDGQVTTGFDMGSLEKVGILKFDMLGLRTLTVIDAAIKTIERNHNVLINPDRIALDDPKTFELLSRAETVGIFQLESAGMRDLMRKIKPTEIEDVISVIALYRPGPIGSGMLDDFIKRKHGQVPVVYPHPCLEAVLKATYGVIVYQEQVMRIASEMAGFSMAQADLLRRAMGKKKAEVMEEQRKVFVAGAKSKGVSEKDSGYVFDLMEHFAGYGFNKSHSAAYAMISFQTAFLKANYPVEFMTALLSSELGNTDKLVQYLDECKRMGLTILPPDINASHWRFTVVDGKTIRCGLGAIKNVGQSAIEMLVQTRAQKKAFKSLRELCCEVDLRLVNRKVCESLIKAGACDSLKQPRAALLAMLDSALDEALSVQRDRARGQMTFFESMTNAEPSAPPPSEEVQAMRDWPESQKLAFEKALLGFYVSGHPAARYQPLFARLQCLSSDRLHEMEDGAAVAMGGMVARIKRTVTRKTQEEMAFFRLEDNLGDSEVLVFPKSYQQLAGQIRPNAIVLVVGRVAVREDYPRLIAEEIVPIDRAGARLVRSLELSLEGQDQEALLEGLRRLLLRHRGPVPIFLNVPGIGSKATRLKLPDEFRVQPTLELLEAVDAMLGAGAVHLNRRVIQLQAPARRYNNGARAHGAEKTAVTA